MRQPAGSARDGYSDDSHAMLHYVFAGHGAHHIPTRVSRHVDDAFPGSIGAISASLIRRGAGLARINAVVMTMSCLAICPDTSSACAF